MSDLRGKDARDKMVDNDGNKRNAGGELDMRTSGNKELVSSFKNDPPSGFGTDTPSLGSGTDTLSSGPSSSATVNNFVRVENSAAPVTKPP